MIVDAEISFKPTNIKFDDENDQTLNITACRPTNYNY